MHDDQVLATSSLKGSGRVRGRRQSGLADLFGKRMHDRATRFRRWGGPAVVTVAFAAMLAACGSSGSPLVASLGTGKGGSGPSAANADPGGGSGTSTTTQRQSNPTNELNEWVACMRSHGDPNQSDPTVTSKQLININWNPAVPGGIDGTFKGGQGNDGPGQYCRAYLNSAQAALGGGQSGPDYSQSREITFAPCMRAKRGS